MSSALERSARRASSALPSTADERRAHPSAVTADVTPKQDRRCGSSVSSTRADTRGTSSSSITESPASVTTNARFSSSEKITRDGRKPTLSSNASSLSRSISVRSRKPSADRDSGIRSASVQAIAQRPLVETAQELAPRCSGSVPVLSTQLVVRAEQRRVSATGIHHDRAIHALALRQRGELGRGEPRLGESHDERLRIDDGDAPRSPGSPTRRTSRSPPALDTCLDFCSGAALRSHRSRERRTSPARSGGGA